MSIYLPLSINLLLSHVMETIFPLFLYCHFPSFSHLFSILNDLHFLRKL